MTRSRTRRPFRPRPRPVGHGEVLRTPPGWVALSIGLLLVNISIELYLPQIPGNAITALGNAGDAASVSRRPGDA